MIIILVRDVAPDPFFREEVFFMEDEEEESELKVSVPGMLPVVPPPPLLPRCKV